jgi:hypothetical protein
MFAMNMILNYPWFSLKCYYIVCRTKWLTLDSWHSFYQQSSGACVSKNWNSTQTMTMLHSVALSSEWCFKDINRFWSTSPMAGWTQNIQRFKGRETLENNNIPNGNSIYYIYIYIVTQLASLSNFLSSKNVKNAEFNHPRESPGSSRSDASPGRPAARSVSFSPSGRCLDNFDWSPAATAAQLGQWMLRWNRGPSWELLRCK